MTLLQPETLRRLWTDAEWTEGPLWIPRTGRVRFSDIPNHRIIDVDPATGEAAIVTSDSEFTNARAFDANGALVECSHGRRRIERVIDEAGYATEAVADNWNGHRLNSPNDVVVDSSGSIWFTDPPYGIQDSGREGHPGNEEYGGCYVFRFDPAASTLTPVITTMVHPNGLAFSPDESRLYVSDTGHAWGADARGEILVFDIEDGEQIGGTRFARVDEGASDGIKVDGSGRLWSSAGDGVYVFSPEGALLEKLPIPETVSNLCFGGADGRDLFITATSSLYAVRVNA
jgi:gluconolactonase